MTESIRWGIVGTAKIATAKVIPALQQARNCEVVAVASRSRGRAEGVAEAAGIPRAYGSYDALLADPDIDAIYNPLPNDQHVPVSIRALGAGKHVLCEKPIALDSDEARRLVDVVAAHPGSKCMEAFMYRHHPQWKRVLEMVRSGDIGRLVALRGCFSYFNDDPSDFRNIPAMGGGGLMDIGCYPIHVARLLFDATPERVAAHVHIHPEFGTDTVASAILDFGMGTASFTCSTQMAADQRIEVYGERGRIVVPVPFNPPPDRTATIHHRDVRGEGRDIVFEPCDQYVIQAESFARSILEDTAVETPISDSVENMRVIEAILRAGACERWERV